MAFSTMMALSMAIFLMIIHDAVCPKSAKEIVDEADRLVGEAGDDLIKYDGVASIIRGMVPKSTTNFKNEVLQAFKAKFIKIRKSVSDEVHINFVYCSLMRAGVMKEDLNVMCRKILPTPDEIVTEADNMVQNCGAGRIHTEPMAKMIRDMMPNPTEEYKNSVYKAFGEKFKYAKNVDEEIRWNSVHDVLAEAGVVKII